MRILRSKVLPLVCVIAVFFSELSNFFSSESGESAERIGTSLLFNESEEQAKFRDKFTQVFDGKIRPFDKTVFHKSKRYIDKLRETNDRIEEKCKKLMIQNEIVKQVNNQDLSYWTYMLLVDFKRSLVMCTIPKVASTAMHSKFANMSGTNRNDILASKSCTIYKLVTLIT